MNSTIKTSAKFAEELNKSDENRCTENGRHSKCRVKAILGESFERGRERERRENKVMLGQYIRSMDRQL
jgi:hypothetical protein